MAWKSGFAMISGLAISLYSLVNRDLSPLFWVLIGALLIDILLNLHNESAVIGKLTKAVAATILPVSLKMLGGQSGIPNLHLFLISAVGVVTLIVLQGVVPELLLRMSSMSSAFGKWLGVKYLPEVAAAAKLAETAVQKEAAHWEGLASDQARAP